MMPGRSIINPAFMPDKSSESKCPSSIRTPAHVWQRLSVGGCSPRDNTQGQKTVQLHDNASSPFRLQLSRNVSLRSCSFNPVSVPRKGRHHDTADNQRDADSMSKAPAAPQLFNRHHNSQASHPHNIHHTDYKHHHHQRPAASEAIESLSHAETEYAARRRRPVGEKERERMLASHEAGMLERRELIDARADKNDCRQKLARSIERKHTREGNLHGSCNK